MPNPLQGTAEFIPLTRGSQGRSDPAFSGFAGILDCFPQRFARDRNDKK
jgi:hypothetical protein